LRFTCVGDGLSDVVPDARLPQVRPKEGEPMAYIVEIEVAGDGLPEQMNQMRAWLDHQRYAPSRFRVADAGAQSTSCRVYFTAEDEAAAFARQFGGRVLGTLAAPAAIL
jgi:hypothetical protein